MKLFRNAFILFLISTSFVFAQETKAENNDSAVPEVSESQPDLEKTPEADQEETAQIQPDDNAPMTLEVMTAIVKRLDPNANIIGNGRAMVLKIADVEVTIIADPINNRMRAFSPVTSLDGVDSQKLYRMLQANFDSALDARYSIAKEHVLSAFIHPFAELKRTQFIEGVGQVVNLVKTYGTAYTSGAMTFGGGDSRQLHRKLIDDLLKKGDTI